MSVTIFDSALLCFFYIILGGEVDLSFFNVDLSKHKFFTSKVNTIHSHRSSAVAWWHNTHNQF